jgi:hypothetical protein
MIEDSIFTGNVMKTICVIMAGGNEAAGDQDIWYFERHEGGWSEPMNADPPFNSGNANIYWVSVDIIDDFWKTATFKGKMGD